MFLSLFVGADRRNNSISGCCCREEEEEEVEGDVYCSFNGLGRKQMLRRGWEVEDTPGISSTDFWGLFFFGGVLSLVMLGVVLMLGSNGRSSTGDDCQESENIFFAI